jgi:hypothetical protein
MKRKRYSVEQIIAAVKQNELGTPVPDIARKLGVAEQNSPQQSGGVRAIPKAGAHLVLCRCDGCRDQSSHFLTGSGFGNFHDPSSISSRGEYMRTA